MKTRAVALSLVGGIIMLFFSFFLAFAALLLHDMTPIDPYVQFIQTLESIIVGCDGFVVAGLAIAGSLLLRRGKKCSRIFIIISAVFCFISAVVDGLIIGNIMVFYIILAPAILLVISCVQTFTSSKASDGNNNYTGN